MQGQLLKDAFVLLFSFTVLVKLSAQRIKVNKNNGAIEINTKDQRLEMTVQYQNGCYIQALKVKGINVLSSRGAFTGLETNENKFLSTNAKGTHQLKLTDSSVTIPHIVLTSKEGGGDIHTTEDWTFTVRQHTILWKIDRCYGKTMTVEQTAYPEWRFKSLSTWKAGIISNGGIVWSKYLKDTNDTYGVHASGTTFWNGQNGNALSIHPVNREANMTTPAIATQYSHTEYGEFSMTNLVADQPPKQRYRLDRFVHGRSKVFAPYEVNQGAVSVTYELGYENYFELYNRGQLAGIDAAAVRDLLNTTARYGVVDDSIVGGNGWLTNWKCLHEPFFAQMAMAIDDSSYNKNLEVTLDREMQLAIQPDGRVLSRWHNEPGDEMPGTYNAQTGYYEARWGYTIDAQPGYVLNVSDLFNLTGNIAWLKTHQQSCEKALEWLIRRDENNNGIFEMKNKNIADGTCSDWLDIVWASYENAFVNAQMYGALIKWADCEEILKNKAAASRYRQIAQRLKTAFNKPVNEGGFWMPEKNQFIYWRDQDGSVHGDNLVTPVQFAAIGYGLCTDSGKISKILDQIQSRMEKEQLFHWPLCFDSYRKEEVSGGNWPFPKYENGDIFLTWGYLGIKSYAGYKKELAVQYIQKLLEQYKQDGLSFQRYGREDQKGLGNDILAGNSTSIAALYSDIYGIQPRWNRLVIDPHLPEILLGTNFNYTLRSIKYHVSFTRQGYQVSAGSNSVTADKPFGVTANARGLYFYPGDQDSCWVVLPKNTAFEVHRWDQNRIQLSLASHQSSPLHLEGIAEGRYQISVNGIKKEILTAKAGSLDLKGLPLGKCRVTVQLIQ